MRSNSLFWGSIVILLGVLFLLDNLNLINVSVWGLIWPIFLIALGFWTLSGAFFRRSAPLEQVVIPLEGAARAKVRLNHGAGRLNVHAESRAGNLVEGSFGGGLEFHTRREGDLLDVKMKTPSNFFPFGIHWGGLDWSFGLNREVALALDIQTGANEARLDLTDLHVTDLRLHSGASATELTLPANAGVTRVEVEIGAASANIHVPPGVAARIRAEGGLSNININQQRFPRLDKTYQSPDYETAANKADIRIEVGVGSVTLS